MVIAGSEIEKSVSQDKLLKIGELAEQADVAVGTIRYYESLGLVEPAHRSESGYRYYVADAIKRVQFIRKAQSLQFSLRNSASSWSKASRRCRLSSCA